MKIWFLVFLLFGLVLCYKFDDDEDTDDTETTVKAYEFEENEENEDEEEEEEEADKENVIVPYLGWVKKKGSKSCTASLISPVYAITSADCIVDTEEDSVTVRFGVNSLEYGRPVKVRVQQFIIHPDYDTGTSNSIDNNIALIRFIKPIKLSGRIQTIAIQNYDWSENEVVDCETVGFNVGFNKTLKFEASAARGDQYCLCLSEDRFICVNETITGTECITDTGGPLVWNNHLIGIRYGNYKISNCFPLKKRKNRKTTQAIKIIKNNQQLTTTGKPLEYTKNKYSKKITTKRVTQKSVKANANYSDMEDEEDEEQSEQVTEKESIGIDDDYYYTEDLRRVANFPKLANRKISNNARKKIIIKANNDIMCMEKESLTVFIYVNKYLDWIRNIIDDSHPIKKNTSEEIGDTTEIFNTDNDYNAKADKDYENSVIYGEKTRWTSKKDDSLDESTNLSPRLPEYFGEEYNYPYYEISGGNCQLSSIKFLLTLLLLQVKIYFI